MESRKKQISAIEEAIAQPTHAEYVRSYQQHTRKPKKAQSQPSRTQSAESKMLERWKKASNNSFPPDLDEMHISPDECHMP